ncbi:SusC/RagA family TonB-linked outer membrane protein [Mariniphaga sediminis]|uniref:SusC/RagA family TonB-linked outer membrane protein n=1 Tax=Mariniphaga sediminis TaxID=1628158 RepID=A0A399CVD4_9BACT|nr:TonB-dependent receptor [Mariniphaga sediminis]RIH63744.1 SusC/RagA family TonB-linked outer membrane protein [Mariniphaga sediminis]
MKNFCFTPFPFNGKAKKLIVIMKLTVFILFLTLMQVSATGYSQANKFSFRAENKQVVEVLRQIEEHSDFRFFFLREQVDVERRVSVTAREATVEQILDELFQGQPVQYEFANEALIVLTRSDSPIGRVNDYGSGDMEQRTVSGKVTDSSEQPLPGVTVVVKGTTQGTVTNADGDYTLANIPDNAMLVFSFVGMKMREVAVGSQMRINVRMEEETIGIEEVVAVGYGTMKKSDITGSVASISSESFLDQPGSSSNSIIAGKAPGVTVRRSNGAPGASPIIRIRGANSLLGNNDPLIVVDGNYGSLPNMYEIESIEILKDASATAIYGSRGANGVILVTTKRGAERKPTLEFHSDISFDMVPQHYDLMDAHEFAEFNKSVGAYPFTDAEIAKFKEGGGTDWQDELLQTGFSQNYKVILSGGSKNIRYYITPGYNKTTGTIRNSEASGYGLKAKVDMDLSDRLTVQIESSVSHSENLNPNLAQGGNKSTIPLMAAIAWSPTEPIYNEDGSYNRLGVGSGTLMNPVLMTEVKQTNYDGGGHGVGNIEFKIIEGLTLNAKAKIGFWNGGSRNFKSREYNGVNANASQSFYENKDWLTNAFLTYSKTFASLHDISAMVGFEQSKSEYQSVNAVANILPIESAEWHNLGLAAPNIGVGSGWSDNSLRSYFGRLNYNYASRYYVTVNYRADGSSKFRGDNRWGYFPSFSLAWRFSEEEFMKNQNVFQNIRIRGGYGVTGSQAISSYSTYSTLRGMGFYWGDVYQSGYISQIGGNPNLKWESTKQLNAGVDFTMIDNRLSFAFDYYNKETVDLLAPISVPAYAGADSEYGRTNVISNVGAVKNEGIEVNLDYNAIRTQDWSYNINLNGAYNWNEVLNLGETDIIYGRSYAAGLSSTSPFALLPGKPIGTIYGIKYLGIWQKDEADEATKYGASPGDYRYEDLNGNYNYDAEDRQVIGNTNPPFTWGFNNRLSYKNFNLNVLFEGVHGRDVMNWAYLVATERIDFTQTYTLRAAKSRWTPDNSDAEFARIGNSHLIPLSSQYVQDGSYVKLRNLSLAYRIPKSVISFASVRLSVSAQNLLTITNYKGYDPEISSTSDNSVNEGVVDANSGMDWFAYPSSKSISFGIAIEY